MQDGKLYTSGLSAPAQWNPDKFFKSQLKEWKCFSSIITGSSRSGKSYLLKHLLTMNKSKLLRKFDFVLIFSKTLVNGFYKSFINSDLMFYDYEPAIIEFMKQKYIEYQKQGKTFKWLVILDDCVDAKSKYYNHIQDLYFHGRHYQASIMFLTQKCSLMATGWMANSTLIICLFAGSRAEKDYIAEKILADAIDEHHQEKKFNEVVRIAVNLQTNICKDYNALIITPYESHDSKVYQYKA